MDASPIEVMPVTVVEAVTRGEVDMQVSTAKRYPRDIEKSRQSAIAIACKDQATAAECMYALPIGGEKIEGGSIRLAEIIFSTYGNIRAQARIIEDPSDRDHVTAMGSAWDLESNAAVSIEKKRRATDKYGKPYAAHVLVNTKNANAAIAWRDAIFKAIPRAYWWPVYEAARTMAIGDAGTLGERRTKLLQYFAKLGVFEERLLANLGYSEVSHITLDDIAKLHGTANLIREGQTTVDEAFPPLETDKDATTLADRMAAKKGKGKPAEKKPDAEPAEDAPSLAELRFAIGQKCNSIGGDAAKVLATCDLKSRSAVAACDDIDALMAADAALLDALAEREADTGS